MKAEDFVKTIYPDARVERQVTNRKEVYYLVREKFNAMYYIGSGKTKAKAWQNAAENLKKKV